MQDSVSLWEILVPTVRRSNGRPYRTRYHRVWDDKVRTISNGLTVMRPAQGYWNGPNGHLFAERMIPVRIACSYEHMQQIAKMTLKYYDQLTVMWYRVAYQVHFTNAE